MDPLLIKGIEAIPEPFGVSPLKEVSKQGAGFGEVLKKAVESVNAMQHEAGRLEEALRAGRAVDDDAGTQAKVLGEISSHLPEDQRAPVFLDTWSHTFREPYTPNW